jgi:hypothetical protein
MTERLPWFPCYPSKLLGALSAMKPTEGYVYWIVCLRIYEVGGPCPDTLDALCRRTGYNKRIVTDALDRLFRSGKLVREAAGIMNPFAAAVMTDAMALHEGRVHAGRKGGFRSAEKRKKFQGKGSSPAAANGKQRSTHIQGQEQREERDDEANASSVARKRACRLPDDWAPTAADLGFAGGRGLMGQVLRDEVDKFRNHWHAKAGKDALSPDWPARWRTWVMNWQKWSGKNGEDRQGGNASRGPGYGEIAASIRAGRARRAVAGGVREDDGSRPAEPLLELVHPERR